MVSLLHPDSRPLLLLRFPPASYGFLAGSGPAQRKALIVYPTVLFYTVIAWLILNDSKASSPTGVSTTATVTTTMLTTENQSASL